MIGVLNIPSNIPPEFGDSPPKFAVRQRTNLIEFTKKAQSRITYMLDGRKMINNRPIVEQSASNMWNDVLIRSAAARMKKMSSGDDSGIDKTTKMIRSNSTIVKQHNPIDVHCGHELKKSISFDQIAVVTTN